jgi:hypothetical protein
MGEHASKIKAFYESQKDEYDAFRKNFVSLHIHIPILSMCQSPYRVDTEGSISVDPLFPTCRDHILVVVTAHENDF